jgi:hypothetical protein
MKKFLVLVAALLLVLVLVFFWFVPQLVEFTLNRFERQLRAACRRRRGSCTQLSKSWTCMPIPFYGEETYSKRAAEATWMFRDSLREMWRWKSLRR